MTPHIKNAKFIRSMLKEFSNCNKLSLVHLSFNTPTSYIPKELVRLEAIAYFEVEDYKLSGRIMIGFKTGEILYI
jgi:hypothetical protein